MLSDFIVDSGFWTYVLVGFLAQIVDGALGMAYGTLSTTFLLATGAPPVIVSASVHTAQFFTTGISAASHAYFKNIDKRLMIILAISGAAGGAAGAMLLTHIDGKMLKPWISIYLIGMGAMILWRIYRQKALEAPLKRERKRYKAILGSIGGFLDALGGGGWGPIVTTSLMGRGRDPRLVIGSVNTAEFFVKTMIAGTFLTVIGTQFNQVVLGLLTGGVLAAPLGAYILRFIKPEYLMSAVGVLIILVSSFVLAQSLHLFG